jgi:hypothetical protein
MNNNNEGFENLYHAIFKQAVYDDIQEIKSRLIKKLTELIINNSSEFIKTEVEKYVIKEAVIYPKPEEVTSKKSKEKEKVYILINDLKRASRKYPQIDEKIIELERQIKKGVKPYESHKNTNITNYHTSGYNRTKSNDVLIDSIVEKSLKHFLDNIDSKQAYVI